MNSKMNFKNEFQNLFSKKWVLEPIFQKWFPEPFFQQKGFEILLQKHVSQCALTEFQTQETWATTLFCELGPVHWPLLCTGPLHWVFSFGDSWDYCFVDEVVHSGPADQHQIPLRKLVQSPDRPLSNFIEKMSIDSFKPLLLEMLGPVLQTSLASLRLSLGQFYSGVRTALGLQDNQVLIKLLKGN